MARANGPRDFWNPLEVGAADLGPTWVALLMICTHNSGVFRLSRGLLSEIYAKLQRNGREPKRDVLDADLQKLHDLGHIKIYEGDTIWIKDRWSYFSTQAVPNSKINALRHLEEFLPEVLCDFEAHAPSYRLRSAEPPSSPSGSPHINGHSKPHTKRVTRHPRETERERKERGAPPSVEGGAGGSTAEPAPSSKDHHSSIFDDEEQPRRTVVGSQAHASSGKLVLEAIEEELSRIAPTVRSEWQDFKVMFRRQQAGASDPEQALATILRRCLEAMTQGGFSPDDLLTGFHTATWREVTNANYVITVADGRQRRSLQREHHAEHLETGEYKF